MAEDKVTNLYNAFVKNGYAMEPEAQFRENLKDPKKRKAAYDALVADGYNMEPFADFESNIGFGAPAPAPTSASELQAQSTVAPATATTPDAEPEQEKSTWNPSLQERIRMQYELHFGKDEWVENGEDENGEKRYRLKHTPGLKDFQEQSKARVEQFKRATMPMTTEGRRKLKAGKFQAQLAGTPTKTMGLTPNVRTAETATAGEGQGAAETTAKPLESAQSPVPYGVRYVNGKPVTEWLLPDGTLTTDLVEADQAEYGARTARLRHQFENRMKQNGLDPAKPEDVEMQAQFDAQAPAYGVVADLWREAEEKHKADRSRNADRHWDRYAAMGGGPEMRIVTASMNRHDDNISHMTRFDIEKMMDNAWSRVGSQITVNCYNRLRQQYPGASDEELQATASQMARSLSDNAVYQYAVKQNTPKSTLEYFGRTVADMNVINSISKGLARSQAGTSGDLPAYEAAMGEYGKNHRVAQVAGTVAGMAVDPVTWVSGGVGSVAGKGAISLGGRYVANRAATSMSAQVGSRLFSSSLTGRIITGAAAGGGNFATYEMLKEGESQYLHGGHVSAETDEVEGYSAGAILKAGGHGLVLGSVTGTLSPMIGNVADKYVKATTSTAGKAGVRFGEVAVSTVAEGTVFSIPQWISGEGDAFDVWSDNLAMMLGFKASHGIKSAPRMIASLRPIKPTNGRPLTQAERNHNRMDFEERLRRNMDASPGDLSFTADEREELRRTGYGELADLFSRDRVEMQNHNIDPAEGAIELRAERVEAETIHRSPEFDGYSAMEELMQDGRVSQAARAKAYYILTGRMLPMGSVTGYTKTTADDGRVTINSTTADGEIVTSRTFKNEQEAKPETDNIMRQAELNSIDVGERYKEAVADDMVLDAAISEVSPGADPATIKKIYRAVKAGNKDVTESQVQLVEFLDDAIGRNKEIADKYRPEAIRAELMNETGIDVDVVLRKMPGKRTEAEQAAVKSYLERLFPEEARQQNADPTPEQAEAQNRYEQGRLLYGRFEEGDPTVQADVDAIALRMQEAYQAVEDAFGAEAEYYMFHVNENPWALVNDPELTAEQQDAVLYYINAKAALDGVMDASNEAADRKRAEVEQSVGKRTHKDNGIIIPATMKVNDRQVYVVKGDVVMFPDGSAVDVRNSSESVVVMDAQTGEYEFTSPDQIFQVSEAVNPQDELDTALSVIEQEQMSVFGQNAVAPEETAEGEAPIDQSADVSPEPAHETASTEEYDRGYEQGLEEAAKADDAWIANLIKIYSQNTPESMPETMKGRLDAYIYEQQRRAQSVPETPENVPNPTENAASDAEIAPETVSSVENGQQTALSRIPLNEQGKPDFGAVDADTAWDAIVEKTSNEAMAQSFADNMVAASEAELKKAEKVKTKPTTDIDEFIAADNERIANIDRAKTALVHWKKVAGTKRRRQAEAHAVRSAEMRKRAEEARIKAEQEREEREEAERWEAEKRGLDKRLRDTAESVRHVPEAVEVLKDMNPQSIDEVASWLLSRHKVIWSDTKRGGVRIKYGVASHTGFGEGERRKLFGLFASAEKGGISLDRLSEDLFKEACDVFGVAYDNKSARDALIERIGEARTMGDIRNYIANNRIARATRVAAEFDAYEAEQREEHYQEAYHMGYDEYEAYEEQLLVEMENAFRNFDEQEFYGNIADELVNQQRYGLRSNEEAVGEREVAADGGGVEVLSGTESGEAGGAPGDVVGQEVSGGAGYALLDTSGGLPEGASRGLDGPGGGVVDAGVRISAEDLAKLGERDRREVEDYLSRRWSCDVGVIGDVRDIESLSEGSRADIVDAYEDGETGAIYNRDDKKIYIFAGKNGNESLGGVLLHENVHAVVDMLGDDCREFLEAFMGQLKDLPYHRGAFGRLYKMVHEAYPEDRASDEFLAYVLQECLRTPLLAEFLNESLDGSTLYYLNNKILNKLYESTEEYPGRVAEGKAVQDNSRAQHARVQETVVDTEGGLQGGERRELGEGGERRERGDEGIAEEDEIASEEDALNSRIEVKDDDWTEGGGYTPTLKRTIVIDGIHNVTQVDAPNDKGDYTGSIFEYEGKTFGDLREVISYIDSSQPATIGERIAEAEAEVNTTPTDGQKKAGNYKKGHVQVGTFDVTIENPKGSKRSGTDADGKKWETTMTHTYGYIRGTQGVDGDHIDVYISSDIDGWNGRKVFVVDQYNPDGSFDEHKVMLGFNDKDEAFEAYLSNYEAGWEKGRRLDVTAANLDDFEKWIESSKRKTKAFTEYAGVKVICPVCGKADIPNYHNHDVVCPQCNSDLSVFRQIDQLPNEQAPEVLANIEKLERDILGKSDKPYTAEAPSSENVRIGAQIAELREAYGESELEEKQKERLIRLCGRVLAQTKWESSTDGIRQYAIADGNISGFDVAFMKSLPEDTIAVIDIGNATHYTIDYYRPLNAWQKHRIHVQAVHMMSQKEREDYTSTQKNEQSRPPRGRITSNGKTYSFVEYDKSLSEEQKSILLDMGLKEVDGSWAARGRELADNACRIFENSAMMPRRGGNNAAPEKQADPVDTYTITPTKYEGKHKTSDVWFVKFNRELTAEEKTALDTFVRGQLTEGKKTSRGWYDRKQEGYMMRSEEAARQLGEMLGNEEAVADAQPLSREDIKAAVKPAEKPARKKSTPKPANTATIDEVAQGEPTEQKKVDYKVGDVVELTTGDRFVIRHIRPDGTMHGRYVQSKLHGNNVSGMRPEKIKRVLETSEDKPTDTPAPAEPKSEPTPKGQFKVTDEMKAQEDELRKLLGIDDEEGSTDSYFRDPDELTPAQKRKVFSLGVDYAFNFLDNGVTSFPEFAKAVVGRLGSKVKPFIKSWYEGAKRVPGYGGEGYTDTAEVDRFDIENFDKPSPDAIRDAEMRVAERKAKEAAEQAERELIAERNEQRKKDEQQTATNTAALAEKAEAVASEAEKHASLAGGRKPERKTILRDLKRIDDTLDEINDQLALLGYYEADLDAPEHEVYGLRRSAEKKAVKDAVNLAKQLVDDLGIELDKVTGKTTEQQQKSRGKNDSAVRANIAQVGGDITVNLPYPDGRNLHISIGLSPTHERGVEPNRGGGAWEGDNYEVDRIMFRFGNSHNHFLPTDVTYGKMLDEIQRAAKWGQPKKQETPKAEPQEEAYHGTVTLKDGREAVVIVANHTETMGEPARLTDYIVGVKGEPGTIKISPEEIAHTGAPTAEDIPSHAKEEESHNGYKRGDEVMWDRYGNGKWEKVKIEDFDADGSPIFESVKGIMSEKGDWSRVKPADGVFGEAKRVATKAQEEKKKAETSKDSDTKDATEKAIEVLSGGKKKPAKKKKEINPEQPVGDLFGGLFDEPEKSDNNVKRESDTKGQGVAKGERAHTMGNDAPRTNGGKQPRGTEPTDKVGAVNAERSDVERGTDGTSHGTDEERGLQQPAGNRGRDEVGTSERGAGAADERGGTSEPRPASERETDNGGKGLSEGEPAAGTREGGRPASVKDTTKKPERKFTRNFRYDEDENEADSYSPKQRLEANVKAIETLADVLFGGKSATDEQKAIISRFRGWGQVDLGNYYDLDHILHSTYTDSPLHRLAKAIQKLDPQGEKKLFGAIKQASLSSYYTPTKIAKGINSFLTLAGFRGGKFLDPSMGNGIFEGTMPQRMQERTEITGVELDWLSGQLSRILYPDANVIIGGFEKSGLAPGSYDVVSSNVPFGSIEVTDPTWKSDSTPVKRASQNRIHNYYAVKMLEALRPGGLLPMMTTTAVMDTRSNQIIREHIAMEGEILGAVRLPDNTFQGTGVNTDVIFVRKWRDEEDRMTRRADPEYQKLEQAFLSSATTTAKGKNDGRERKVEYNGYYALHPENMIGEVQAGNQYKEDAFGLTSRMSVDEIASAMEKAIKRIVGNRRGKLFDVTRTVRESQQAVRAAYKGDGDWVSNGNLVIQDGKVGVLNAKSNEYGEVTREFEGTLKHDKMLPRIKAMIDVRTAMKRLIAGQIEGENDKTLANLRSELQKAYDAFVDKYGRLHDSKNAFILDDIDGYTMQALEKWKSGKFEGLSDIFTKNTIKSAMRFDEVNTPQDAISASLAEYGYVRPDFMSKALGDKWADQCADFVFLNPNTEDDYVTRDEYLSGDVVTKLADAREAAKNDNRFEKNVAALEEVQPTRIPFDDIAIGLGARWIPDDILNDFVQEIFGLHANYSSRNRRYDPELGRYVSDMKSGVRYIPEIDTYEINIDSKELGGAADEWETPRKSAKEILKAALEDKTLVIKMRGDEDVVDEEQTELANQKIEELREKFEQWLPSNPDRVERLEQEYNDRFNRTVKRKFNGQHLVIPGLMGMELRPHQKDAVWMLINNRGGIVDHIVGAGKTLVMQAAIMEMRRMGIAKKPMIVALKSTVSQIAREFKEAFPSARVLAPNDSDFQKENRKKFIANISLNDYDCVILSHEQYGMLPHTEEAEQAVISEQLQMLDNMIEYLYGTDQSQLTKRQIKALEVRRKNLIAKMEKRMDRKVDREFCFENLGVDYLFVDESHQFKSLPYVTSYQQIAGLADAKGSNRAVALLTGIRHLQKMHQGDKGVVFLSGTTITNSLVEIYNLLNCLRPREMQRLGMTTFDAWASVFADHTSELEAGTTGEFRMKDRFRSFKNVPELSQLYAEIADVRNDTNLKLPKPALQSNTVIVPASDAISEINREIVHMLNTRDGSYFGINPDNPDKYPWGLAAATLSAKAAVSPRLIFPDMEDEGGKVSAVCSNVKKYYDEMTDQKGVQLIFCELGVPGKDKAYDVYTDIIERLTNDGIPKSEIAYIQQATTEEKRKDLFQRVRDGKVRILIGGTKNMGTGVNVQTRITDMHMVTVPWTPSALEQCLGRGGRQGNIIARDFMGNKVRVHYYATEGSLDLYKYQLLDAKGKMFTQFKMGTVNGERTFDEGAGEEDGFDPAEMVARLSGNPVIFERAKQDKKVKKLRALRNGFERDYQRKKAKFTELTDRKDKLECLVRLNERDVKDLEREGFVKNDKGVYPSQVMVIEGSSMYGGRRFDKPKEAGEYILDLLSKGKNVTLAGFGKRAKVVTVTEEADGLFASHYELHMGDGISDIKYTTTLHTEPTTAGLAFRSLLEKVMRAGGIYSRDLEETKNKLNGLNIGDGIFPRQAELDEAVAKLKELNAEYNRLGDAGLTRNEHNTSGRFGDKAMLRPMEEGEPDTEMLESLTDDELVPVFRNVQVLPGMTDLASPMAAKDLSTGGYRTIAPRQWNGSYSNVELTEEQQMMYDELAEKGYVMIDGKKRTRFDISPERYFEARATKEPALMFKLDKGVDGIVPASENPYDHGKFNTLNLQFSTGYKRPNLVMVQSVMPKSELRKMMANDEIAEGMYHAPFAKNSTGIVSWTNGDKLALSRWSKIIRVLTNQEVAERINSYWQKNPAKSPAESADARDPFNYTPQVLERLQEMGWKFDEEKLTRLASRTPEEIEASYQGMPYVTDEDIARLNAKYADKRHSSLWDKEPDEFLREAEENTMADKVQQMSERMNTPVRILRTPEEIQAYARNPREAKAKGISRIERGGSRVAEIAILLPNNTDLADVENTFLHEVMGHDGLRLLFPTEKLLNNALDELYNASTDAIKADIDARAKRMYDAEVDRIFREKQAAHENVADANANYYTDMAEAHAEANAKLEQMRRDATEEYGANVAGKVGEKGFEKMTAEEQTFWGKMKAMLQKAFEALLRGLKIPKMRKWTDKQWAYIYHKAYKMKKANGRMSVIEEAEDITMRRKTGYDADERTMFRDPDMSLEETITKMKAEAMQANAGNLQAKRDAMRAIGGNLNHLRQAMARQREYDITTAKSVKDLARILMENGLLDTLGNAEVKSLLAQVTNSIGRQDISKQVDRVFEIMVNNHLRNIEQTFGKLISMRTSRADGRGINVQGALDPDGEAILKIFNAWKSLSVDEIDGRIADAIDSMSDPYAPIAERATLEYTGLQIARNYAESIAKSKQEEKIMREEIKKAKEEKDAGRMTADAYRQFEEATRVSIQQMKLDRIAAYESLMMKLGGELRESVDRAKAWREAEKERVNSIHHLANSDMQGRELRGDREDTRLMKLRNHWLVNWLLEPMSTLDQMLKMFGSKNPNGEGYMQNHFMRGWIDAADKEQEMKESVHKQMDEKAAEIFGKCRVWYNGGSKKVDYTYSDLYDYAKGLPGATITYYDGAEMREYEIGQGELLYLYAVEKMPMGRATNRRMGIDDATIENITNALDPKLKEYADWVQDTLLPQMGDIANEVHKRMFGADMDAIENYFPFVRDKDALKRDVENGQVTQTNDRISVQTGAIKKRVASVAKWNIRKCNFMDVLAKHVDEMTHWTAFAELNRDFGTLLSYNRLKQQVFAMNSVYGSGEQLWKRFQECCAIATDAYEPQRAKFDRFMVQGAKGVTMGKISLRTFTALKQTLSLPAFFGEVNMGYVAADLGTGGVKACQWAWKNMPNFRKRILSRTSGDYRLKENEYDGKIMKASSYGMLPNIGVDAWTIAVGSHGVYKTRKAKYLRWGMEESQAERRAMQDAELCYNKSQQSSEGPFMAPVQVDHTFYATSAMLFRNSSTSYTREAHTSARNLKRLISGEVNEEYVAKQILRTLHPKAEGAWTDAEWANARKNAKREIRSAYVKNTVNLAMFGWILPWLWRIGGVAPILLLSGDDDEKQKQWEDATRQSMFAPVEGLAYGDVIADGLNMLTGANEKSIYMLGRSNPIFSDIMQAAKKADKDMMAAANDVINIIGGMAFGVNPQTITDWTAAIIDYNSDAQTQKECALLVARLLSCPPSQLEKVYFEELDLTAKEASGMTPQEVAERYAEYKMMREAPLTGWLRSEAETDSIKANRKKKVFDLAKERINNNVATERTKQLLSEYDEVTKRQTKINKLRKTDREAFRAERKELLESVDMRTHGRVKRYKRDMQKLTERYLTAKTPAERDSIVGLMFGTRDRLLEDLDNTQQ